MLDGVDRSESGGLEDSLLKRSPTGYSIRSVITDRSPIGENTENINSVRSRMAAPEK
ncbi:MAG: hypothetical protein JGK24_08975 [Microcoleus sp. PH2017_29_MFU_D_A]|uniref:hypothetical protein n=1 Tax=unclassified Microcoleus TaxID=2642155 RepID=UPI001D62EBF9|nr:MULTISPECIES: hypothetical protein [unclassified Microcoleus]MCC3432262.1 hypothetical protein [Microcoleus sp. PH2017_04_SCI_O_A]MCC3444731.1 hypothetical protein [Microcoleus sp. PH2017_03_ELD_O_A]MCC3467197.1 hypothetical protein [Microcoleus sp. PH2017_06_SFM_O_A]MCC3507133.1 hypothetical protein [Microcoleus sp. PH2017_19_SFW_U_A]MCC3512394.1 hypothetical protein [Microcoleus sp. PH2017_17_BER_D_A]